MTKRDFKFWPWLVLVGVLCLGAAGVNSVQRFPDYQVRSGSQPVTILILTTNIAFTIPMLNTNYAIHLTPSSAVAISYGVKTTTGFSVTVAAGLNGFVDWMAIAHQ